MARKFALVSTGPLSGKSTLAARLRDEYGFILADHSLTLVRSFVDAWNEANDAPPIMPYDVYRHKESYRGMLQRHGDEIGFNDPGKTAYWIKQTLEEWLRYKPERDVVFDSFRGEAQGQALKDMGFTLVQLEISENERCRRAMATGKYCAQLQRDIERRPDLERGIEHPDIILNAGFPTGVQAQSLMILAGEGAYGPTIYGTRL